MRKRRRRSELGVEPRIPSENLAASPETCPKSQVQFNSSKASNVGQNLTMADPEANSMVAQKLSHKVQKVNSSVSEIYPNSADLDLPTEAIKSPAVAGGTSLIFTSCRRSPDEGFG